MAACIAWKHKISQFVSEFLTLYPSDPTLPLRPEKPRRLPRLCASSGGTCLRHPRRPIQFARYANAAELSLKRLALSPLSRDRRARTASTSGARRTWQQMSTHCDAHPAGGRLPQLLHFRLLAGPMCRAARAGPRLRHHLRHGSRCTGAAGAQTRATLVLPLALPRPPGPGLARLRLGRVAGIPSGMGSCVRPAFRRMVAGMGLPPVQRHAGCSPPSPPKYTKPPGVYAAWASWVYPDRQPRLQHEPAVEPSAPCASAMPQGVWFRQGPLPSESPLPATNRWLFVPLLHAAGYRGAVRCCTYAAQGPSLRRPWPRLCAPYRRKLDTRA